MARSVAQSSQRYPLTQVLGTEANVRLLRELSLHGGQLSAPSLVSRTALAKGSVRTGLNALLEFGVVVVRGNRHAQLYSLRLDHPLRAPIEALFEAEQARFDAIQQAIRQAATTCEPSPIATYVYGSVARGQDRPDSDLDILIIAEREDDVSTVTGALREALEEPAERIGFLPSVIGLSLDDITRYMRDAQSSWRGSLQEVMVVTGKDPTSLARLRTSPHGESTR
jgi:predicted nucleotidyltransferase